MNKTRAGKPSLACPPFLAALLAALFIATAGCGGGGGGGGGGTTPPPPDPTPKNPPVQSGWSPPKNSVLNSSSKTISFETDANAYCRWALQDLSYDSMSSACATTTGLSHACSVSGLEDGSETVYVSCAGITVGKDTADTNEDIPFTVDTIKPAISITYPANGQTFNLVSQSPPSHIDSVYSDSGTGVLPETLSVTYSVSGRSVDITSLFGKSPSANASSSTTSPSETDPLGKTTVARFNNFSFGTPLKSWSFARGGRRSLRLAPAGGGKALVWNTADRAVSVINISQGTSSLLATLPANPVAVAVSTTSGRFYVVYSGSKTLYSYFLSNGSAASTNGLAGFPTALAYDSSLDRVYIAYSDVQQIGVWLCQSDSPGASISIDHTPLAIDAWADGAGRSATVASEIAGMKAIRVDTNGARLNSVVVGQQQPRGFLAMAGSGYILSSVTSSSGTPQIAVLNTAGGSLTNIANAGPGRLFAGPSGSAIAINEDDWKAAAVYPSALSVSAGASLGAPPSDGLYDATTGSYLIADDLYLLPSLQITITATISDAAGNTGATSVSISMYPESSAVN